MTELTGTVLHSERSIAELCMDMAFMIALSRSKDPRTKVGACLYDTVSGSFHLGYNGFPKGIADTVERWENRELKHRLVRHAEEAAVVKALLAGARMDRSVLSITNHPCHRCVGFIVSCDVKEIRYALTYPEDPLSEEVAAEAGARLIHTPRTPPTALRLLTEAAKSVTSEADMFSSMQRHFGPDGGLPGADLTVNKFEELETSIDSYLKKNGLPGILPPGEEGK